jgi:hypothetical protein
VHARARGQRKHAGQIHPRRRHYLLTHRRFRCCLPAATSF